MTPRPTAALVLVAWAALAAAGPMRSGAEGTPAPARRVFAAAVRPVGPSSSPTRIVRTTLSFDEQAQPMTIAVSLRMRNLDELQARLARGQNVPNGGLDRRAMEERYLPSAADYEQVRAWLVSRGLAITCDDRNHTTVFARGTVASVAEAFEVPFARVATPDGEFSSAVGPPSLPSSLPTSVLTVDGLQPHIRGHAPAGGAPQALGNAATGYYIAPADVMAAYAFPAGATGSGQTIAVIMSSTPLASDLTQFWTAAAIPRSIGTFTAIPIEGGPDPIDQINLALEVAIDIDWSTATAPGAAVRLYAIPNLLFSTINEACIRILADAAETPGLSVVTMSIAGPENQLPIASYAAYTQTFAQLAAAGISVLACSGDGGSNPNPNLSNGYSSSFALGPEYPASDPYVAGIGGTNLDFTKTWAKGSESAWSTIPPGDVEETAIYLATGGGISMFPRPPWQEDGGAVLASNPTSRCVPDLAGISVGTSSATGGSVTTESAIVLYGNLTGCYGTSLATPIWAGIIALVNQAREANKVGPVGLLGPALYPLHGTSAFNDIIAGSNGAYRAGPGYDLCTGLGSPNVAHLIQVLEAPAAVVGSLPSGTVTQGAPTSPVNAGTPTSFSVAAAGPEAVTYQWYLDGVAIGGANGASYQMVAGAADAGAYSVAISGAGGTTTLEAGTLSVATHARLTNLSARAQVEGAANLLIAGFVTTGLASKSILVRGAGPALAGFGVSDFLADPTLELRSSGGSVLAANSAWTASLAPIFSSLGAFAFAPGSGDTALLQALPPGAYTAQVASTQAGTGVAIAEVYDADEGAPANRLINLSARATVGSGSAILIGGFVIEGTTSETVVVRAIGPALLGFGLNPFLSNPVLTVLDAQGRPIAQDAGWENPVTASGAAAEPATAYTFSRVGAFALAAGSADCALVLTLPPGQYTAQVTAAPGSSGPTGAALVEVYELR